LSTDIQSFFIVTDIEQTPYVLYDKEYVLQNLEEEYKVYITKKESIEKELSIVEANKEFNNKLRFTEIFKFLYGMPDVQNLAVETIKEYQKDDKNWIDCYNDKSQPKLEFISDSKYLLLIRLSNLGENENFVTSGMLGFYGKEPLYNKSNSILPKQLLMLLRHDVNAFIEKHHKNEEFSGLIQQKEKADYQFMLRHGIDEYKNPLKKYSDKIYDSIPNKNDDIKKLKRYFDFELTHLTNKIDLMQIFSKFNHQNADLFETFNLKRIIETFNANYESIFKFERNGLYYLNEKDNIDDYIQLIDQSKDKISLLNTEIDFPVTILEEMIFELVYNIRKHVLNCYSKYIKNYKLYIYIDFTIVDDIIYFKISNNYCVKNESYFNRIYNNNKLDGLNLINSILKKADIGGIKVTINNASDIKDKFVNIYIPLKKLRE
jgi:hypothetical protein